MESTVIQDLSFEVAPVISEDISLRECMEIIREAVGMQKDSNYAIQKALVAASAVAFNVEYHHKNVLPFTMIVEGLRGADRQTIIKWIESHTPARWAKDDGKKGRFQFDKKFQGAFDFDILWNEKWYDLVPPERTLKSTIDFREQIDLLVKRLTREMECTDSAKKKEIKHAECLEELKALQGRLSMAQH